jgi:hypothetical protein
MKKAFFVMVLMILAFCLYAQGAERQVTYIDFLFSYFKGTRSELSDDLITSYIRDYYGDVYRQYSNNEFEWHDKIEQYREEFAEKAAAQNLDTAYVIAAGVEFGNYDFDKNGFPVNISAGTFFPLTSNERISLNRVGLFLLDFHKYNFFSMERNEANTFIRSRTESSGTVSRDVRLVIYFKLADFSSSDYLNISTSMDRSRYYPVVGIINRIEVYDNTKKIGDLIIN